MNSHLFMFTVGPVQSFIAQARKTQDLFAGSQLLSDLIQEVIEEEEIETIFPYADLDSMPNRFLFEIETDDPQKEAESLESLLREKFASKAKEAISRSGVSADSIELCDVQLNHFLEVHYGGVELNSQEYSQQYSRLSQLLGSTKNLRPFTQLKERGRKCSICGERNAVFHLEGEKNKYRLHPRKGLLNKTEKEAINAYESSLTALSTHLLTRGEALCSVCFSKRFYSQKTFPSTAEIALSNTLEKIKSSPEISQAVQEFKKLLGADFDYQLLFEENLTTQYFEKFGFSLDKLEEAGDYRKAIVEKTQAIDSGIIWNRYYALVLLDGDNMGAWMSGKYLQDSGKLRPFQRELSVQLGEYSKTVKDLFHSLNGKEVYVGGDDVLGFINLDNLYDLLEGLRREFPAFESIETTAEDVQSSASCGVIIAHYKDPLTEVLQKVRKLEKEAKSFPGKDAICLGCLKKSGDLTSTTLPWKTQAVSTLDMARRLSSLLREGKLTNTFIYTLREEFTPLMKEEGEVEEKWLKAELNRLALRSFPRLDESGSSYQNRKEKELFPLCKDLMTFYGEMNQIREKKSSQNAGLESFLSFLETTEFLSKKLPKE